MRIAGETVRRFLEQLTIALLGIQPGIIGFRILDVADMLRDERVGALVVGRGGAHQSKRGLLLRTRGQQGFLLRLRLGAVERDGQRSLTAQLCHLVPLSLPYRLFYGVDVIFCELFESFRRVVGSETAVGIHTQLYLPGREMCTDMAKQSQLILKADSADFQLSKLFSAVSMPKSIDGYGCIRP